MADAHRASRRHARCTLTVALLLGGCIDFVEPDLPERGAPAVLEAMMVLDEQVLRVSARLAPGLNAAGRRRQPIRETLRVAGVDITPDTVLPNGTRHYQAELPHPVPGAPLELEAPELADVVAPAPAVRWFAVRRPGGDTLDVRRGEDVTLALEAATGEPQPVPESRQWVMHLVGDGGFSISSTGAAPEAVIVPARWIPATTDGKVSVLLIDRQSAQLRPAPGDYLALVTLDRRVSWTLRMHPR